MIENAHGNVHKESLGTKSGKSEKRKSFENSNIFPVKRQIICPTACLTAKL